ncbi:hypothetical protein EK904_008090, partial [Melospiza melodia maxima]
VESFHLFHIRARMRLRNFQQKSKRGKEKTFSCMMKL